MAYTTINKPDQYFNATAYTANGGIQTITNSGSMQPDLVWTKVRSTTSNNILINAIIGASKYLYSNTTGSEVTDANYLTSFNSNGFSVGSNNYSNGTTMIAWQWRAANSTVSNTQGTITSTVSANTTAGFSIVSFDLTGKTGNQTVGHGLVTAPKVVITKRRSGGAGDWTSYFGAIGNSYLVLNSTAASATSASFMNNTAPTSTVFTVGDPTWWSQSPFIAYCFAEIKGFSKFGSYVGNGSTDGTFIYTGFKPAYLLIKRSDSVSQWRVWDNKRNTYNVEDTVLLPNDTGGDTTNSSQYVDFLSNGFKWRASYVDTNASGGTFIYMAFAENPFVSSTLIPTTAR